MKKRQKVYKKERDGSLSLVLGSKDPSLELGLDRPGLEGLKSGGPLGRVAGSARGEMVNVSGGGLRRSFCEADNAMI